MSGLCWIIPESKVSMCFIKKGMPGMSPILKTFSRTKSLSYNPSPAYEICKWIYGTPASTKNSKSSFVTLEFTLYTSANKTNIFTKYSPTIFFNIFTSSKYSLTSQVGSSKWMLKSHNNRHLRLPYEVAFDPLLRPEGWELRRITNFRHQGVDVILQWHTNWGNGPNPWKNSIDSKISYEHVRFEMKNAWTCFRKKGNFQISRKINLRNIS